MLKTRKMKKLVTVLLMLSVSFTHAQVWSNLSTGLQNPVYDMTTWNNKLYISNSSSVDVWDGTNLSNVLKISGTTIKDIAGISSIIMAERAEPYISSTGATGTWSTNSTANAIDEGQLVVFNNDFLFQLSSDRVDKWDGATFTSVTQQHTCPVMSVIYDAKANDMQAYRCGRVTENSINYGLVMTNTSGSYCYGAPIKSTQAITDFIFVNKDVYACISGLGFAKQTDSTWTTILADTTSKYSHKCVYYKNKLFFTTTTAKSTIAIFQYDPTLPVGTSNPSSIAEIASASSFVGRMYVYNNKLYIGGSFTDVNTASMGLVKTSNIICFESVPKAVLSAPDSVCGNSINVKISSISLNATSYQWYINGVKFSAPATTSTIYVDATTQTKPDPYSTGSFTVTLTAIDGNLRDSVTKVIKTLPIPAKTMLTASGSLDFCEGDSVTIISGIANKYLWHFTKTNWFDSINITTWYGSKTISAKKSGMYAVTLYNANGCSIDIPNTITVTVNSLPIATINQVGSYLTTTSNFITYQWLLNDNPISGAVSKTYTPVSSGKYRVMVTNLSGCSDTSNVINFVPNGIESVEKNKTYDIKTLDGFLVVSLEKSGLVEVYDVSGRLLYTNTGQYHYISLLPGIYIVRAKIFTLKVKL